MLLKESHDLGMELQYEIEAQEDVERCLVHIDYETRDYDEHVVSKVPELREQLLRRRAYKSHASEKSVEGYTSTASMNEGFFKQLSKNTFQFSGLNFLRESVSDTNCSILLTSVFWASPNMLTRTATTFLANKLLQSVGPNILARFIRILPYLLGGSSACVEMYDGRHLTHSPDSPLHKLGRVSPDITGNKRERQSTHLDCPKTGKTTSKHKISSLTASLPLAIGCDYTTTCTAIKFAMPKVSQSPNGQNHASTSTMPAFSPAPRLVSFENSFPSGSLTSDDSSDHSQSHQSELPMQRQDIMQQETSMQLSQRTTTTSTTSLARHKPSLSLVDLEKDLGDDTKSFRQTRSAPVSPLQGPMDSSTKSFTCNSSEVSATIPSSPWGHFVDMVIPSDDDHPERSRGEDSFHPFPPPHMISTSPRTSFICSRQKRRFSPLRPYHAGADYYTKMIPSNRKCLRFVRNPSHRNLMLLKAETEKQHSSNKQQNKFRLTPRQEPTDHIISGLIRLHFR
eukprot:scaffold22569_cov116-Cylindrotheca_fusiformis.AAC.3